MSEWRDISTAPVNVSVLIFIPNAEHYGPGIYRAILVDMGTGRRWHATTLHMGRDLGRDSQPTHWQFLPEPPKLIPEIAAHLNRQPSDDLDLPSDSEASS